MNPLLQRIGISLLIILTWTFSLSGCSLSSSTKSGSVGADRKQLLIISSEEMNRGAEKAYADILAQSRRAGTLNRDSAQLNRVRSIAERLRPHTQVFRSDAPNWNWEVNVIDSNQLNAWCMPGGKIAFYSGIINRLALTDGEIAAIMGHEIAHALREHGRERASEAALTSVGLDLLVRITGASNGQLKTAQTVTAVTLTLPNSRQHETEADRMGVELAARAGFDPYAAVNVWQKMAGRSKDAPPEILSTHPSNASRIADLKRYAAKVKPFYDQAKK